MRTMKPANSNPPLHRAMHRSRHPARWRSWNGDKVPSGLTARVFTCCAPIWRLVLKLPVEYHGRALEGAGCCYGPNAPPTMCASMRSCSPGGPMAARPACHGQRAGDLSQAPSGAAMGDEIEADLDANMKSWIWGMRSWSNGHGRVDPVARRSCLSCGGGNSESASAA